MADFEREIEQQIPRLRRFARAMTRDCERSDDLVQNCLARALAKQHLFQSGTDLRAWLFTILHREHVNDVRRSARQQRNAGADVAAMSTVSSEPTARLELRDLDRAISKLPEKQRRAVLLIGLEGMAYEQAAKILGVPIGTVRSRLGRAREALREQLDSPKPPKMQRPEMAVFAPRHLHAARARAAFKIPEGRQLNLIEFR